MRFFTLTILLLSALFTQAQSDTTIQYLDKDYKPIAKANATFVAKTVKDGQKWHKQISWTATNIIRLDDFYADSTTQISDGPHKLFTEQGILKDSSFYRNDRVRSSYSFYENHKISGYALFTEAGIVSEQAGMTEDGKIIPGYIFQQEAQYPGGDGAWKQYLVKGLSTRQPKAYLKGKMSGTVVVVFLVYKDGTVQEASVEKSSGFSELDEHALNVVRRSPKWIPAIQYNKKVIYRQRQSLTYAPVE